MKEYIYEPSGTRIRDEGEGRVVVEYWDADQTLEEATAEGLWIRSSQEQIAAVSKKPIDVLVDLGRVEQLPLDDALRQLYRDTMAANHLHRIAIVGDSFMFTRALSVVVLLSGEREKVKFFFKMDDAKDWLGW